MAVKMELIEKIKKVNEIFKDVRPLTAEEIEQLKKFGNWAEDWSKIKVGKDFKPERVRNSFFFGEVIIGSFEKSVNVDGLILPSGIYRSTIVNSKIANNSLIKDVKFLANSIVCEEVVIMNVDEINCKKGSTFGNGEELPIAIETGGREVKVFSEIPFDWVEKLAYRKDSSFLSQYEEKVKDYVSNIKGDFSIFFPGVMVKNSRLIDSVIVGEFAIIENACKVSNSTILSNKEERTEIKDGALVSDSLIQWGCEVSSMGIVDHSLLAEHSHVERHGKVTNSIIGPNTGIGEGEVTSSLVGPFVGFHHQALLIAALWPEGKGNVGYGANVGSNHTGKAPDQEIWPGEGLFFGLGVNIKFPANFKKSPYTIIATGVTTLPQCVEFPFSLINIPSSVYEGISPAINEIMPGWVLKNNIFMIKRNEEKYKKRNKAKRTEFVFEVFRPEIVDLMIDARKRLMDVKEIKQIYTEKEIKGLGKNYLLEERRKEGIEAYTFYIQWYALTGLKRKIEEILSKNGKVSEDILREKSDDERWEHERKIILQEFPDEKIPDLLKRLSKMQRKIAEDVESSKAKDDIRGKKIIPDYEKVHTLASDDEFVKKTWQETEKINKEIEDILSRLEE
ncbi:MAG TPA: DUF4954 family protein [bacterium]|nr:DUF4954 family protein [bacterium]